MQFLNYQKQKKGFTLVETLVAITVLLLVIIGPMTVAQKGIQNAYYANEQIVGVFLAQEAIESVRALRDEEALNAYQDYIVGNPGAETWDWIPVECLSEDCAFVPDSVTPIIPCTDTDVGSCEIWKNVDTGSYTHVSGDADTPFTRTIRLEEFPGGIAEVTVNVTWNAKIFGGTDRSVQLQTWLYDHYQRYEN